MKIRILTNKQYEKENEWNIEKWKSMKINEKLDELEKKYALLIEKKPDSTQELANRIADLEVKMAKLWAVIVEVTPTGKQKMSKFGKVTFGGKSL